MNFVMAKKQCNIATTRHPRQVTERKKEADKTHRTASLEMTSRYIHEIILNSEQ
jgi:hypothetical protein